jgi:cardiolipin synthase
MDKRILTVPNQLTFLRMGFLPFFIIAIHYDRYDWALGILLIAGLSDGLDGLLARRLNQRSPLGAYLDPIADKLLLSSSYLVLALKRKIAFWLAIIVLGRDVLILVACAAILLVVGYRPFPPNLIGKATTGFEILLVFLVILNAVKPRSDLQMVCGVGGYIVAFLAILSGLYYSGAVARRLSSE